MKKIVLALSLFAVTALAADAKKGQEVFESNCGVCHSAGADEKMGPGFKGLFKKAELRNKKKVTDANVQAMIDEGGNGMPGFADGLTKAEKADVIAYLKTL